MSKLSDEDIRHLVEITDDMAENSEAEGDSDADNGVPIHLLDTEEGEANNSSLASDMPHELTRLDLKRQKRMMKRREMCRILFLMMKIFIGTV
jgi:hypothetical protein